MSPADSLPKAYTAARKAVEIDPQSAEAHASLGLVFSHSWNWAGAEAEFRRALWSWIPNMQMRTTGTETIFPIKSRHDEALAEASRALELDPANLMISTWVARCDTIRHVTIPVQSNKVETLLNRTRTSQLHNLLLGVRATFRRGLRSEGVSELKRAASLSGGSPLYTAQVAVALAATGRRR